MHASCWCFVLELCVYCFCKSYALSKLHMPFNYLVTVRPHANCQLWISIVGRRSIFNNCWVFCQHYCSSIEIRNILWNFRILLSMRDTLSFLTNASLDITNAILALSSILLLILTIRTETFPWNFKVFSKFYELLI